MTGREANQAPADVLTGLRSRIDVAPMSRVQKMAIGITFLLSALDGYDLLAMSFAAPAVATDWGIGQAELGIALAAGLGGMAVGSLFLSPLADIVGRKTLVLLGLAMMAIGMLCAAYSSSLSGLISSRIFTGLGIGACVAVLNTIAAEFANARHRALCVAITAIGVPIGGAAGGLLSSLLLQHSGWPAIFIAGSIASFAMVPIVVIFLPESFSYLMTSRRRNALDRLNSLLQRCGHDCVVVTSGRQISKKRGYAVVFASDNFGKTVWITSIFACLMISTYYLLSWLPQMITDLGFSPSIASLVSGVVSLSGVLGGLTLGWLAQRVSLRYLFTVALTVTGLAIGFLGFVPSLLPVVLIVSGICGFFLFGAGTGAYATLATTFDDTSRVSGTGFAIGIGRIASVFGPSLAGWMLARGLSQHTVSSIFGCLCLLAAVILGLGWRKFHRF